MQLILIRIFFSISATVSQSSEIIFSAAILTIFCFLKVLAEYKPDKTNPVHAVIFSSDWPPDQDRVNSLRPATSSICSQLLGQEKICLPLGLIGSTCISLIPHFKLVLVQIFQYIGKIQGDYKVWRLIEGGFNFSKINVKSLAKVIYSCASRWDGDAVYWLRWIEKSKI